MTLCQKAVLFVPNNINERTKSIKPRGKTDCRWEGGGGDRKSLERKVVRV